MNISDPSALEFVQADWEAKRQAFEAAVNSPFGVGLVAEFPASNQLPLDFNRKPESAEGRPLAGQEIR